jgi:hypothetical protein
VDGRIRTKMPNDVDRKITIYQRRLFIKHIQKMPSRPRIISYCNRKLKFNTRSFFMYNMRSCLIHGLTHFES